MKKKTLLIPIMMMFLLVGCQSSGGSKTSKTSTSSGPESKQDVPSYEDLPEYDSYDPETGPIAPNHLSTMTISPNKEVYARVGDIFTVTTSTSTTFSEAEKYVEFSVDKQNLLKATAIENPTYHSWRADLKCLASGDATLTAKSYEGRYVRQLVVHILPNSEKFDYYETALDTDTAKSNFGFISTSVQAEGLANGISQLGHQNWKWHREKPAKISTSSGALAFGSASDNEGGMTFSTHFVKPVKKVTLGIASARDDAQENLYIFGASKLTATMGETALSRVVNNKTYAGTEECYTLKGTDDNTVFPHTILCNDLTGEFTFSLTESAGYIRLKYIVVEYGNYTPAGTLTDATYSFDDEAFTSTLTENYAKKTISDSSSLVNVVLTKVKAGDETTSNHPMIQQSSTITITPKETGKTITNVELVTSPFIYNEQPIENIVEVKESYLGDSHMRPYGTERSDTIVLSRLAYGCNVVELKAATKTITAKEATEDEPAEKIYPSIGIVSLKVTLTDAVSTPTTDGIYLFGTPIKTEYDGGDKFNPLGAVVVCDFTDLGLQSIAVNDLMTWPELTEGDTETTGTCEYGDCVVTGITTGPYVNKTWVKATSPSVGNFLVVSRDSHMLLDGSSNTDNIKNGSSNRDIKSYFVDDEIHGDYGLDHSNIVLLTSATAGMFKVTVADQSQYFQDVGSNAKFSFSASTSTTSKKNHSFELVNSELVLYFSKTTSGVAYTYTLCLTTYDYFGYVDLTKTPELCKERVDFYQVK